MGFVVRPAAVQDAAAIAAVHVRVWREAYDGLMDPDFLAGLDVERFERNWAQQLAAPGVGARIAVGERSGAVVSGAVVGWAVAGRSRDEPAVVPQELHAINVLASAHGTGLALALMDAVVEPGPCSLWVARDNDRAIRFYAKRGFVADGAMKDDERLGVTEQRMVRPG